jgi:hypothetical protein
VQFDFQDIRELHDAKNHTELRKVISALKVKYVGDEDPRQLQLDL